MGLIYNSLKGNAVCGSWHLLCLNRGDIHMFIGVFILLCNPLSIQNALCSQNVYYFKSKGKITWANEKRRVMLQWIPSCSSFLKSTHCGELKILKKLSINIIHGIINMCGQIDHLPLANTCSVSHTHLTVCGHSLSALQLVESCFTIGWI